MLTIRETKKKEEFHWHCSVTVYNRKMCTFTDSSNCLKYKTAKGHISQCEHVKLSNPVNRLDRVCPPNKISLSIFLLLFIYFCKPHHCRAFIHQGAALSFAMCNIFWKYHNYMHSDVDYKPGHRHSNTACACVHTHAQAAIPPEKMYPHYHSE